MCRKRDADSHPTAVRLPAVEAMRGRRRCDEVEVEVEVEMEEEEVEYMELEKEFLRFCAREEKMTAASRRSPASATAKKPRAERPITDESAPEEEKSNGGKRCGGSAGRRLKSKHGFRGVHRRTYGRWAAEIRDVIKGSRVWIGTYDTAEEAARAYDDEARRIHGRNARTNFPRAPPPRPPPPSPAVTNKTTEPAVLPAAGEPAGDPPAPVVLARALEATDGWEFEPYSMGLLGGVGLLGYVHDELLLLQGGATSQAGDGCLWLF